MSDYPNQLEKAHTLLQTEKNLPELFCQFVDTLETIPSSTQTPEIQAKIDTIFQDVNRAISKYNQQLQILMRELGTLCKSPEEENKIKQFFSAYLDLLRLAYSIYINQPDSLSKFQPLLQLLLQLLETKKVQINVENIFTNALLLQVVKSAWLLTNTRETMKKTAEEVVQIKGGKRTRKQKRRF